MATISNVKITKKMILDKLQAKLVLLNKKLTQQELLDKALEFTQRHFDEFVNESIQIHSLTREKVELIRSHIFKGNIHLPEKKHDELLYGS